MNEKNLLLKKRSSKIHQIMIVDGGEIPEKIPEAFHINAIEIQELHKNIPYKMWGGTSVRELIKNNFDKSVLDTYDTLVPYAYKCDLARLCVLYVEGGLYVDLGVKLMREFKIPENVEFCVFRDLYQETNGFMMQNGLIFSEKGRPELLHSINWIVQNCMNRYYGLNSLYPTGPVQLGRAVALVSATSGPGGCPVQWIGECRAVTPSSVNKNMIYTDPFGNLTALRAKVHAGDLAHMGLKGGNNHNVIWQNRKIYGEPSSIWRHDDQQIQLTNGAKRTPDGITINKYKLGRFTYGPYIQLKPGNYELSIKFKPKTNFSRLFVEVCNRGGADEIFKGWFDVATDDTTELKSRFFTNCSYQGVEIRLSNDDWFEGFIEEIEISSVDVPETVFSIKNDEPSQKLGTEVGFVTESGIYARKNNPGKMAIAYLHGFSPGFYNAELVFQDGLEFERIFIVVTDNGNEVSRKSFSYEALLNNEPLNMDFCITEYMLNPTLFVESDAIFEGCLEQIIISAGTGFSHGNNSLVEILGIVA
ncbi:glycosyltransferase [Gluconobacter oxydans]|uniref:glycosyltransferase n=1 Tax=Gluconobacter oxydans TaxID=442 RepID=UPI0039EC3E6F